MSKTDQNEANSQDKPLNGEKHEFEAEVGKLLDLMINSLYSDKDIFLRELISNASDACDKLRYASLTDSALGEENPNLAITISLNKKARTITVSDNGIGMDKDELVNNLGTIAKSGTEAFVKGLSSDQKDNPSFIGQFGVGFYSTFMVARKVEVITKRAGAKSGWRWVSNGMSGFEIEADNSAEQGATIILHLRDGEDKFFEVAKIREIVKAYSDHIDIPIKLSSDSEEPEVLNTASAIWMRQKSDITSDNYTEFFRYITHSPGEPWKTIHLHAEGTIEYSSLLFIPDTPSFDLFDSDRKHKVKLYVRKVFITDECEGLIPSWLRFLRGVVDSSDLPLNISRETLQYNPILAKIRAGLIKRVLGELKKSLQEDTYLEFWKNFGAVLKEGIYEDPNNKKEIMGLAKFRSTSDPDAWVSLADYVKRMPNNQEAIYYLSGDDESSARFSPHLEGFKARGLEVLIMTDPVDQFWLPAAGMWDKKPFKSVTQGSVDIESFELKTKESDDDRDVVEAEIVKFIALIKMTLGEMVKDVRISDRLTDSPVCLVADDGDVDIHLEKLMQMHKQPMPEQQRVLEINPKHPMIRGLTEILGQEGSSDILGDSAYILLDQARILEGRPVVDAVAFSRRLSSLVANFVRKSE